MTRVARRAAPGAHYYGPADISTVVHRPTRQKATDRGTYRTEYPYIDSCNLGSPPRLLTVRTMYRSGRSYNSSPSNHHHHLHHHCNNNSENSSCYSSVAAADGISQPHSVPHSLYTDRTYHRHRSWILPYLKMPTLLLLLLSLCVLCPGGLGLNPEESTAHPGGSSPAPGPSSSSPPERAAGSTAGDLVATAAPTTGVTGPGRGVGEGGVLDVTTPWRLAEMPACARQPLPARYAEWRADVRTAPPVVVRWTYGNVSTLYTELSLYIADPWGRQRGHPPPPKLTRAKKKVVVENTGNCVISNRILKMFISPQNITIIQSKSTHFVCVWGWGEGINVILWVFM